MYNYMGACVQIASPTNQDSEALDSLPLASAGATIVGEWDRYILRWLDFKGDYQLEMRILSRYA